MSHVKIRILRLTDMKPSTASQLIHSAAVSMFFALRQARRGERYRWENTAAEKEQGRLGFTEGEALSKASAAEALRHSSSVEVTSRGWGRLCGAVAVMAGGAGQEDSTLRGSLLNAAQRFCLPTEVEPQPLRADSCGVA